MGLQRNIGIKDSRAFNILVLPDIGMKSLLKIVEAGKEEPRQADTDSRNHVVWCENNSTRTPVTILREWTRRPASRECCMDEAYCADGMMDTFPQISRREFFRTTR